MNELMKFLNELNEQEQKTLHKILIDSVKTEIQKRDKEIITHHIVDLLIEKDLTYGEANEALDECKNYLRNVRKGGTGLMEKLVFSIDR